MNRDTLISLAKSDRCLLLVLVCLCCVLLGRFTLIGSNQPEVIRDQVPSAAQADFKLLHHFQLDSLDGLHVSSNDILRGPCTVLNFGSMTCGLFLQQADDFEKLALELSNLGQFYFVYTQEAHPTEVGRWKPTLTMGQRTENARAFADQQQSTIPVLVDRVGAKSLARQLAVNQTAVVLVDRSGHIRFRMDEYGVDDLKKMREAIEALLAAPVETPSKVAPTSSVL